MFQIGYSRIDITPTESVPLAGFGLTHKRMSSNVLDPLYSTCTALTDEYGTTVLLFHNDVINSPTHASLPCRQAVSEATGLPVENVIFCATHTHSGPDMRNVSIPSIQRYNATLPQKLVQCAKEALADRKNATACSAKVNTDRLNFVRHYMLEDGHYKGDNFGDQYTSPIVGHVTQPDQEMRLVKFVRQGGKDVLMVNWQVHPLTTGGFEKPDISADIIGAFRKEMEDALDCHFTFFLGGAGNLSPYSRIKGEVLVRGHTAYGAALKEHALTAEYQPLALGPIRVAFNDYTEPLNRPDPGRVEAAQKVADYWANAKDTTAARFFAIEHGFSSQYAATLLLAKHRMESDIVEIPLTAISFGDFGFATAPCEMFDTNMKYVRDFSPFPMTFVSTCTNGGIPYIPSAYAYIHDCYEAAMTHCLPGAGERVAQNLVQMLKRNKEQ